MHRRAGRLTSLGVVLLALLCGLPIIGRSAELDSCALLSKAEVAKIIGELKEEPKPGTGLLKEKQCDYINMSGAWLKISLGNPDTWGMQKGLFVDTVEIKGLGEEAFSAKRGTAIEVWVRKGNLMLVVSSTVGLEPTRKVAEAAAKKLP